MGKGKGQWKNLLGRRRIHRLASVRFTRSSGTITPLSRTPKRVLWCVEKVTNARVLQTRRASSTNRGSASVAPIAGTYTKSRARGGFLSASRARLVHGNAHSSSCFSERAAGSSRLVMSPEASLPESGPLQEAVDPVKHCRNG